MSKKECGKPFYSSRTKIIINVRKESEAIVQGMYCGNSVYKNVAFAEV